MKDRLVPACCQQAARVREAAGPWSGERAGKGLAPSRPPGTWPPLWRHSRADSGEGGWTPRLCHEYARGNPEVRGQGAKGAARRWGRMQARSHGLTVQLSSNVFCYLLRNALALDLSEAKRTKGMYSPGALVCVPGNRQRRAPGWVRGQGRRAAS